MLKLILIITLGVPDVSEMERAYTQWLGYTVEAQGEVDKDLARAWDAPKMAGRKYALMRPESKANIYLRFVQVKPAEGYVPMKTFGWNAIEMLAQDLDKLNTRLGQPDSPFKIVGVPRPLGPNSPISAMQVVGPAKEVLYLTHIPPNPDRPNGSAKTLVDRPFILIVSSPELESHREFWGTAMGAQVGGVTRGRLTVLNKAQGLDIETTHPYSVARVSPEYSIEIDGYPPGSLVRPVRKGELPPAMAMVGFEVESLDQVKVPLLAPARAIKSAPYNGRRVGVVRGKGGELIELIETATR
ncbi:MAG: hypothetical protein ABIT36_02480 [Steroidobacteraceae bacterium]